MRAVWVLLLPVCLCYFDLCQQTLIALARAYDALSPLTPIFSDQTAIGSADVSQGIIYLNGSALRHAPHSFWNVLKHEQFHTLGFTHWQPGIVPMNYMVTTNPQGTVVDDTFVL